MRMGKTGSRTVVAVSLLAAVAANSLLFPGGDSMAADSSRGQLLYENHCMVCHTSIVHVREQRKASSREEIQVWIRRWQQELGLNWGAREVDDVSEFLNQRYYRLEKES